MGKLRGVDELFGVYRGKTVFVMGSSGSLKHLELSRLEHHVVIGANDAIEEWEVDYLLIVDGPVLRRYLNGLQDRPETKLLTTSRHAEWLMDVTDYPGDIYEFRVEPAPRVKWRGSLRQLDNTAHYAIEIAWRMLGCKGPGRVVLVGVDMRYPTKDEREQGETDHSFGDGAGRNCKPNFSKVLAGLAQTRNDLAGSGIELVTCSPWDGPVADMITRRKFDDLMDEEDEKR